MVRMEGSYTVAENPWKTVQQSLTRLSIHGLDDPEIPPLDIFPQEKQKLNVYAQTRTWVFRVALAILTKNWQQLSVLQPANGENPGKSIQRDTSHRYRGPTYRWIHQGRISNALSQRQAARLKRLHTISLHSCDILEKAI